MSGRGSLTDLPIIADLLRQITEDAAKPAAEAAVESEERRLRDAFVGSKLPDYMIGGLVRYVCHGIEPGDFLTALLKNDARRAVNHADPTNSALLGSWFRWLGRSLPGQCWGSAERVRTWLEDGGIAGKG